MISIEICMGSSCFARGNRETLEILENYMKEQQMDAEITVTGSLCMDQCSCGPHLRINGNRHDLVAPEGVLDVLNCYLEEERQ